MGNVLGFSVEYIKPLMVFDEMMIPEKEVKAIDKRSICLYLMKGMNLVFNHIINIHNH